MYFITTFKYVSYIFVAVGILTVALCLLVLYFDIPIPNELKGFVFFAQVILNSKQCLVRLIYDHYKISLPLPLTTHTHTQVVGIVYQNTPYLSKIEGSEVSLHTTNLESFAHMFILYLFHFSISSYIFL